MEMRTLTATKMLGTSMHRVTSKPVELIASLLVTEAGRRKALERESGMEASTLGGVFGRQNRGEA